ncbi:MULTISPECIES: FAD-binding oxidoreductase [Burkholderiaceae]|uniref:FAD-binding PCMH-type domain-containing protein n=1 Tax=Paraburkholderia aromaticivorans TaxID=2026199 RepID=A0A248VY38_9BURK|nr:MULTISPECIES: FAD-binding oxidoreductase [Burkholderiaceae]ASW03949.1 hypothetical protein CJU94_37970 [Paraburkholderia aromaticivorans]
MKNFSELLQKSGIALDPVRTAAMALRGAVGMVTPKFAVRPATVEQVQTIQKAAKADGVTLWVTPNHSGNGLQAPAAGSERSVLVDLSRMNRILKVDTDSAYVLVEPGVSYGELRRWLKDKGFSIWVDAGRDDDASIMGGILDRAFGYTAYGDHAMMQCGLELVMRDGTLVRTGMGAFGTDDGRAWQLFKYGFGPYTDGLYQQGDWAVPTKVGFWISPQPPAYRPFALRMDDEKAFVAATEAARDLRINMVVPNNMVLIDKASDEALYGPGASPWNLYGAVYGLPKNLDFLWTMLHGLAGKLGGRLEDLGQVSSGPGGAHAALMRGEASAAWCAFHERHQGRYLRLVFALPIEGDKALRFVARSRELARESGCDLVIEQGTSWRALLAEVLLVAPDGDNKKQRDCAERLIQAWALEGIGVVRADPALRAAALGTYADAGFVKLRGNVAAALTDGVAA